MKAKATKKKPKQTTKPATRDGVRTGPQQAKDR